MLQLIRDKAQGWIAWVIVGLICIPFALWGVQEYLGPDPNVTVIEINGQEIGLQTFTIEHQRTRYRLGGIVEETPEVSQAIRTQTIERLVRDELMAQVSAGQGLRISDEQLALAIQSEPAFKVNGQYSPEAYERTIATEGYSPGSFENVLRRSLVAEQFASGIMETAFSSARDVEWVTRLELERRTFATLRIAPEMFDTVDVSDAELEAYFDANKTEFRTSERVKTAFIKLSRTAIAEAIEVSEDTLRTIFQSRVDAYRAPEELEARHILIELASDADDATVAAAREQVEKAQARLAAGEDFAAVAKDASADPGSAEEGGSLGSFGRGVMDPAFEAAAFSQEIGVVGEPVRTPFGFHLIRVDSKKGGGVPTFEQARKEVLAEYKAEEADKLYYELAERLATIAFEQPDNLEVAAEELGLKIEELDWMTQAGIPSHEVASDAKFVAAAFSDEVLEGNNSDPVELTDSVIVLRMREHQPESDRTLDEARDDVREAVVAEKRQVEAVKLGTEIVKALRAGGTPDAAEVSAGSKWQEHENQGRDGQGVTPEVNQVAFALPRPKDGNDVFDGVENVDGSFTVVSLTSVSDSEELPEAVKNLVEAGIQRDRGESDFRDTVRWLRDGAEVVIHDQRL